MSIHNKRLNQITEKVIQESLQQGILPSSKEFIWRMNQEMLGQKLHMPRFKFQPYKTTELINAGRINQNNDDIHADMTILYDNIIDVHKLLNKYQSNFEVEKEKLATEISQLENTLKEKIMAYNAGGYLAYSFDGFDDLSKTDTAASSDIFVDTKEKQVRLVEEKNTSLRVYPLSSNLFSLGENGIEKREAIISGDLNQILSDETDTPWQKQISLKSNQGLTGLLELQFEKPYGINKIDIDFMSIKRFWAKVEFSTDGNIWYELPYNQEKVEVKDTLSVQFPTMMMKSIRIIIDKPEPDETVPDIDGFNFNFLFGVKKIQLYNKQYPSSGLFQTTELELQQAPENYRVDKVRLSVKEVVPTGTAIRYEISLPNADGTQDWHPIDPMERVNPTEPQQVQFSNIKRKEATELFFPEEYSIVQSEAQGLLTNGIPIYRLSTMVGDELNQFIANKAIVGDSMKLYTGRNSWEVTSFPSADVNSLPTLDDWKQVHDGTEVRYSLMNNSKSGDVLKGWKDNQSSKYLCKAGFYLEGNDVTISTTPIGTDPFSIFVNGDIIHEAQAGETRKVNISLRTGWNEIAVLVNGKNATSAAGISISLGFNPQALASKCYSSSKSLKHIPLFDLQYNTKQNDRTVFSSRTTEEGIEILTNFAKEGLKFDLYYDYADESAIEMEPRILLRAHFARENGEDIPSPTLKSYRLEFS